MPEAAALARRSFIVLVGLGAVMAIRPGEASSLLDDYRWKKRLLVVIAPAGDAEALAQRRIVEAAAGGMTERDMVLVEALDDSTRSRQIRNRLSADGTRFKVFLVGKDGHVALASDRTVSAELLFGKIDAMPMRRDEMRRGR